MHRWLLPLLLLLVAGHAPAQVAFHLAYISPKPGAEPAGFPNDRMFKYMSVRPLIPQEELMQARAGYANGQAYVELWISDTARNKVNDLAAANAAAQDRGAFEDHVALAVVADGEPKKVIQGVFQALPDNKLRWNLGNSSASSNEDLREAEAWAKRINERMP
jgi:hypothetical protein